MLSRLMFWMNFRIATSATTYEAVPAPSGGGTVAATWWYDTIANMAPQLAALGCTEILLPCPVMGDGGDGPGMDGYSCWNDWGLGDTTPTRFGTLEKLRRCIAICHASGIMCHIDIVLHQRMGGDNGIYQYPASGGPTAGRFPKQPSYFRGPPIPPRVAQDPIPDVPDDYEFGDEFCPVNALPKGILWKELQHAGDYWFRALGADGARQDDCKGINAQFMEEFCKLFPGKFFFGEYADGSVSDLNWYLSQVDGCMSLLDFAFHYNSAEIMCNDAGAGTFNMATLGWQGLIASNPMKAVPFVESMDSDTDGFGSVKFNKILGYALLLTGQGLPLIYIKDFMIAPYAYGLQDGITNLCWIHTMLVSGDQIERYSSNKLYVFERTGGPGCIIALNNDVWNPAWYTVTVQTNYAPGTILHDYTGHNAQDSEVQDGGMVTFGVPPGQNGDGYVCFSRAGLSAPVPELPAIETIQEFEGATDLIQPCLTTTSQIIGRIWCAVNTPIKTEMFDHDGRACTFKYVVSIAGPTDAVVTGKTVSDGWHSISANTVGVTGLTPYRLRVSYTATKTLSPAQY